MMGVSICPAILASLTPGAKHVPPAAQVFFVGTGRRGADTMAFRKEAPRYRFFNGLRMRRSAGQV